MADEPIYKYYKLPLKRNGTSVWIFAAHKTSEKLKAIMAESGQNEKDFHIESGMDNSYDSIDYNSPEGKVIAQIYAKRYQEKSEWLARMVNSAIEKTNRPALGVNQRQVGIWVLQATKMPSILIETGFINNEEDEIYLNSESGQVEMARAITNAVLQYKLHQESTIH
jgi:N-acetylmuramoyl-L-alanine amidase